MANDLEADNISSHISQKFNEDLVELKSQLLEMGGLVESQIQQAVESLVEADEKLAKSVRATEKKVNAAEVSADEACMEVLALRQPAASDLRLVMAISKGVTDLERIGDEANKIAKMALRLAEEGKAPSGYREARHIGQQVQSMLREALDAFARLDVEQALKVAKQDKVVDQEYNAAMRQLVTFMIEDPRSISRVLNVVWSLRALERVGDHARNIAELVIYLVKGEDVRHISLEEIEQALNED